MTQIIMIKKLCVLGGAVALFISLMACSSFGSGKAVNSSRIPAELLPILSGETLLHRIVGSAEYPNEPLFILTDAMKTFAAQSVKGIHDPASRVTALHRQLIKSPYLGGQGIRYSALTTDNPQVVFTQSEANCLSYSLLFVAMAKEVGLDAWVNEVTIPSNWERQDDNSFYLMRHVNAKVRVPKESKMAAQQFQLNRSSATDEMVIDLEIRLFRRHYPQAPLTQREAEAQFYSNKGIEFASRKETEKAFLYLRKALERDMSRSYLWNNFGGVFLRNGSYEDAAKIYLHAHKINPKDDSVLANLAGVYKRLGDTDKADAYLQLSLRYRESSPYYQYRLAEDALSRNDVGLAEEITQKILRSNVEEPRFYRLAIKVAKRQNKSEKVDAYQKRLDKLLATFI